MHYQIGIEDPYYISFTILWISSAGIVLLISILLIGLCSVRLYFGKKVPKINLVPPSLENPNKGKVKIMMDNRTLRATSSDPGRKKSDKTSSYENILASALERRPRRKRRKKRHCSSI